MVVHGARVSGASRERIRLAILKALAECDGAAGASRLAARLDLMGVLLQPRTIRLYLGRLDAEGLTRCVSRRQGRELTEAGRREIARANVIDKVGFVAAKVDSLGYRMSFNCRTGRGTIVANVSLVDRRVLEIALREAAKVFACGWGMGTRMALFDEGTRVGNVDIPVGRVGVVTVCSVTVNGILLHEGVPVTSRFGGLVEVRNGQPVRFVELIEYGGTTLDPLEAFINAGMTSVRACVEKGTGLVGASLREVPSVAVGDVERLRQTMEKHGLGGILALGGPNQPLLDVPVAEGRTGMVVVGGMNPLAAVHEAGIRVSVRSLVGLLDASELEAYEDVLQGVEAGRA